MILLLTIYKIQDSVLEYTWVIVIFIKNFIKKKGIDCVFNREVLAKRDGRHKYRWPCEANPESTFYEPRKRLSATC